MNTVIVYQQNDSVSIVYPTPDFLKDHSIDDVVRISVPSNVQSKIIDQSLIPKDVEFRGAWKFSSENGIDIDFDKAKSIAHDIRRVARSEEFKPWDVKATIPSEATQAEAERQKIRDKYAVLQVQMDAATTIEALKNLLPRV